MPQDGLSQEDKPSESNFTQRMIDFFGGVKEFNTAMALLSPSIINILQSQVENQTGMVGMYQLGSGALLLSGNYMFFKQGDPSMHSRMGMLTGGMKAVLGVSLFAVGMVKAVSQNDESSLMMSMMYLGYCSKTLSTVLDIFNTAVYGKQAWSAMHAYEKALKND